ncbi:MAG: dihydrofolate reductase family protein, partial [Pannonibacter sp.]
NNPNDPNNPNGQNGYGVQSSDVNTMSNNDFWRDLTLSLEAIVGGKQGGRSVVVSPQSGVLVIRVPPCDAGIDPLVAVTALANRGITRLMVEGGALVAASFLDAGLIDEAFIFTGRPSLGPGAILPFAGRPLAALTECPTYRLAGTAVHGPDRLTRLARKEI